MAWVQATLGEPDHKSTADDGTEIWKWSYTETRSSSGHIFLLFGGNSRRETNGHAFVEFKDGVVINKWRG